jgi:hypothetical protein
MMHGLADIKFKVNCFFQKDGLSSLSMLNVEQKKIPVNPISLISILIVSCHRYTEIPSSYSITVYKTKIFVSYLQVNDTYLISLTVIISNSKILKYLIKDKTK